MISVGRCMLIISCVLLSVQFITAAKKKVAMPPVTNEEGKMMGMKTAGIKGSDRPEELGKCMGQDIKIEPLTMAAEACKKEMKVTEIDGEKNPCFVACMWKKLGLIEKNMMFTQDPSSFVSSVFPKETQEDITAAIMRCERGSSGPLSMDNNCSSYRPLRKCVMKSIMQACRQ